jgi:hypothetical protein
MCSGLHTTVARQQGTTVHFDIIMDGLMIPCGITMQALERMYGMDRFDPMSTLQTHGLLIERLVERIVDNKRFEPDGSVLIRVEDLRESA